MFVNRHIGHIARPFLRHVSTKPEQFLQTVVLSNGATFTVRTTSPKAQVILSKDTRNHPLWNPAMLKEGVRDESEQLSKFQKRFGADSNLGDLSWIESDMEMSTAMKKAAASGGYKKPAPVKKGRGKK
ncbi:hypothetical protein K492DRAFT_177413 [Lichtheimia hyalospora FSU 10163]|nr:hypothetical protein K492DRAFT_177413 [Lichtheimia hyalospora FSU 10163]